MWQLNRPLTNAVVQWRHSHQEFFELCLAVSELLLVGDEFGQFEGELEIIVTGGFPIMNGRHTWRSVKVVLPSTV